MTTGICRQLLALPGLDGLSSLFRDTGLWQCAVYFRLLAPSLAMILLSKLPMQGYNCEVSPLPSGICGVMIVDLPWTHAKARAQTLNEYLRCSTRCNQEKSLVFIQDQGCAHVQPRWPSHSRTNGESILFCIDSSPFMPSWHLDKPTKDSAI